MKLFLE